MKRVETSVKNQFAALRWQLLASSLGVIALTLGVGAIGVYQVVARGLYGQMDQELLNLADAAAHNLPGTHESARWDDDGDGDGAEDHWQDHYRELDNDGDLDIPWGQLRQRHQGIEWFNVQGQPLHTVGQGPFDQPLAAANLSVVYRVADYRVVALPVYTSAREDTLLGYVRVSGSMVQINQELERLRQGLIWGGLAALGVCGLGSWGLMRLAMGPIEASFERLRQFTADASHELRSPLTAIKTSVEVIQSHPERVHPADVKKVAAIANASQQMGRLVDDLLLLARLDNYQPDQATFVSIPLEELLEDLVDVYTLQADTQGITFKTHLAAAIVQGDGGQLKRLFANLLDNAVKYTPAGGSVSLSCQPQDTQVVVQIQDTGIGIAAENMSYLYDRFWRADRVRSHRDGSGLGLAIAQSIVQAHKGSLTITSHLHQGTHVLVRLPGG